MVVCTDVIDLNLEESQMHSWFFPLPMLFTEHEVTLRLRVHLESTDREFL
jgi:hypothetical protein